jgi:hypothetical protein
MNETTVTTPNEPEIRVERIFDAPRADVYPTGLPTPFIDTPSNASPAPTPHADEVASDSDSPSSKQSPAPKADPHTLKISPPAAPTSGSP